MSGIIRLLPNPWIEWIAEEPLGSLLVLFTAFLLLGHFLSRSRREADRFSAWLRWILEACTRSALFLGIVFGLFLFFQSSLQGFRSIYGPFSQFGTLSWLSWHRATQGRWPITQSELSVRLYTKTTSVEAVPRPDPSKPPLYRNVTQRQEVTQNSIVAFHGNADLLPADRAGEAPGEGLFNVYRVFVRLEYEVANNLNIPVGAEFRFPLAPASVYTSILVSVDGQDIGSKAHYGNHVIDWMLDMAPGEHHAIVVSYVTDIVDGFIYAVPEARQLRDFNFDISVTTPEVFVVNSPDAISVSSYTEGNKSYHSWNVEDAIMAPNVGILFVQGQEYAPYDRLLRLLASAPGAFLFLITIFTLTLLICGTGIRLSDVALFSSLFSMELLLVMGANAFLPQFIPVVALAVLLEMVLIGLVFRHLSRLALVLILVWVGLLAGLYPFSGLIPDTAMRNALDTIVPAIMILYVFGLALYIRIRDLRRQPA